MKMQKRVIIAAACCVAFLAVASFGVAVTVAKSPKTRATVVLDAGHGGIDGGVTGAVSGVKESELNLKNVK